MSPSVMGLTTKDPYIQKEHTKLTKSSSFVLIGPILNKIQPFKNFKICKEMYGFQDKCPAIHTFVSKFWVCSF